MLQRYSPTMLALEDRSVPAVSFAEGTVSILGTELADYITVVQSANALIVHDNGQRHVFAADQVQHVEVNTLGGADRVILQDLRMSANADGGAGNDFLNRINNLTDAEIGQCFMTGNEGNDLLLNYGGGPAILDGAAGNDQVVSQRGDGGVVLRGGAGSDALVSIFGSEQVESDSSDNVFKL